MTTVLFDLDGTLVDTAPDLIAATHFVCSKFNFPIVCAEKLKPAASKGIKALLIASSIDCSDQIQFEVYKNAFLDYFSYHITDNSCIFDGILPTLEKLNNLNVQLGVVTNKPIELATKTLRNLKISYLFNVILGFDSPNCAQKPKPDSLIEAKRLLKTIDNKFFFVGDDTNDILAAIAEGNTTPIFAKWGYGQLDTQFSSAISIEKPQEILNYI